MSGNLWFKSGLDNSQLKRDVDQAKGHLNDLSNTASTEGVKMQNSFDGVGSAIAMIGGTAAIGMLGKQILDTTAKFEKFGIVLKNTLGEVRGAESLDMLAQFSATTPFQLDEVTASFIKMANQGFVPTRLELVKLGDLASSTGKSFDQLTEALLDAQTGQFERLKEFGIKASSQGDKVTFSFKEQQTTVDNTNSAIQKYILSLGELKGVAGANALISESLTGQLSNLEDKLAMMFNNIGTANKGMLYGAVGGASTLIENYETVGKVLMRLVATYGAYRVALMIATSASKGYTVAETIQYSVLLMTEKAQVALNKSMLLNPYVAAIMAVVGLTAGIYLLATRTTEAEKAHQKLKESFEENSASIRSEQIEIDTLFARLKEAKKGTEEYKTAKDAIQSKYSTYLQSLGDENTALDDIAKAYEAISVGAAKAARARGLESATKTAADDLAKEQGDLKKRAKELLDDKFGKDSKKSIELYYQLVPIIESGKGSEALNKSFAKLFDENTFMNSLENLQYGGKKVYVTNQLKSLVEEGEKAKKVFNDINKEALIMFGEAPKGSQLREGDKKTEGGIDYIFKNGKWEIVPVSETPAQRKKREAEELKAKKEQEEKLKDYEREKQAAAKALSSDELALLRSKTEDKKKLFEIDYQETLKAIDAEQKLYISAANTAGDKNPDLSKFNTRRTVALEQRDFNIAKVDKDEKDSLLENYRTYNQKKLQIEQDYAKDSSVLIGTENQKARTQKYTEDLQKLKDELMKTLGLQDLYVGKGTEFLNAKIKSAMPLFTDLSHLTIAGLENVKKVIGEIELTPEQLNSLEEAGIDVQALVKALDDAKKGMKETVNAVEWDKVLKKAEKVSDSVYRLGSALEKSGGTLGRIGTALKEISSTIDGISLAFDKSATSEQKIGAAIDGIIKIYEMVADQISKNKAIQREWNDAITESIYLTQLAKIETLEYKQANIFGVDNPYSKIVADMKVYTASLEALQAQSSALENGKVQTGTKKKINWDNVGYANLTGSVVGGTIGGVVGGPIGLGIGAGVGEMIGGIAGLAAKKVVKTFATLKQQYGEIYDKNTFELNPQILADYGKLDEDTKKLVDNWKAIEEKAKAAKKDMQDTMSALAGDLGKSLSDSLIDAFSNGDLNSAIDTFHAKATSTIQDIISQIIFDQIFGQQFKDLQTNMESSFGEGDDQNIVDDIKKFEQDYQKNLDLYNKAMTDSQAVMKESGFDIFTSETARQASSKGFASMSQSSADELNGRFTAMQGHTFSISEGMKILQTNSAQQLKHLAAIETNTNRLTAIETSMASVKAGIDIINDKGVTIKY